MTSGEKLYGQHLIKISSHPGPKKHRWFGKSSVRGRGPNDKWLRRRTEMFEKYIDMDFASLPISLTLPTLIYNSLLYLTL
jgi:hypothetical protein